MAAHIIGPFLGSLMLLAAPQPVADMYALLAIPIINIAPHYLPTFSNATSWFSNASAATVTTKDTTAVSLSSAHLNLPASTPFTAQSSVESLYFTPTLNMSAAASASAPSSQTPAMPTAPLNASGSLSHADFNASTPFPDDVSNAQQSSLWDVTVDKLDQLLSGRFLLLLCLLVLALLCKPFAIVKRISGPLSQYMFEQGAALRQKTQNAIRHNFRAIINLMSRLKVPGSLSNNAALIAVTLGITMKYLWDMFWPYFFTEIISDMFSTLPSSSILASLALCSFTWVKALCHDGLFLLKSIYRLTNDNLRPCISCTISIYGAPILAARTWTLEISSWVQTIGQHAYSIVLKSLDDVSKIKYPSDSCPPVWHWSWRFPLIVCMTTVLVYMFDRSWQLSKNPRSFPNSFRVVFPPFSWVCMGLSKIQCSTDIWVAVPSLALASCFYFSGYYSNMWAWACKDDSDDSSRWSTRAPTAATAENVSPPSDVRTPPPKKESVPKNISLPQKVTNTSSPILDEGQSGSRMNTPDKLYTNIETRRVEVPPFDYNRIPTCKKFTPRPFFESPVESPLRAFQRFREKLDQPTVGEKAVSQNHEAVAQNYCFLPSIELGHAAVPVPNAKKVARVIEAEKHQPPMSDVTSLLTASPSPPASTNAVGQDGASGDAGGPHIAIMQSNQNSERTESEKSTKKRKAEISIMQPGTSRDIDGDVKSQQPAEQSAVRQHIGSDVEQTMSSRTPFSAMTQPGNSVAVQLSESIMAGTTVTSWDAFGVKCDSPPRDHREIDLSPSEPNEPNDAEVTSVYDDDVDMEYGHVGDREESNLSFTIDDTNLADEVMTDENTNQPKSNVTMTGAASSLTNGAQASHAVPASNTLMHSVHAQTVPSVEVQMVDVVKVASPKPQPTAPQPVTVTASSFSAAPIPPPVALPVVNHPQVTTPSVLRVAPASSISTVSSVLRPQPGVTQQAVVKPQQLTTVTQMATGSAAGMTASAKPLRNVFQVQSLPSVPVTGFSPAGAPQQPVKSAQQVEGVTLATTSNARSSGADAKSAPKADKVKTTASKNGLIAELVAESKVSKNKDSAIPQLSAEMIAARKASKNKPSWPSASGSKVDAGIQGKAGQTPIVAPSSSTSNLTTNQSKAP